MAQNIDQSHREFFHSRYRETEGLRHIAAAKSTNNIRKNKYWLYSLLVIDTQYSSPQQRFVDNDRQSISKKGVENKGLASTTVCEQSYEFYLDKLKGIFRFQICHKIRNPGATVKRMKAIITLGFGFFCFLCSERSHWQSQGWVSTPQISINQRPLIRKQERNYYYESFHELSTSLLAKSDPFDENQQLPKTFATSFETALCVIPPDEKWDTLQRARHFAQDLTYHQWPPAIRLFYPFCPRSKLSDIAFDLANVVEKYNIKPFDITLDRWTVMPLPDIMTMDENSTGENYDDPDSMLEDAEYLRIQALISSEEKKGKERLKQRQRKQKLKFQKQSNHTEKPDLKSSNNDSGTPFDNAQTQTQSSTKLEETPGKKERVAENNVDEFNGPSMIALEPDEVSSRRLRRLRELFRRELVERYGPPSPSTDHTPGPPSEEHMGEEYIEYAEDIADFRPLIPIGSFSTTDEAVTIARKLKGLWDPLTFSIADLHFISQAEGHSQLPDVEQMYDSSVMKDAHLPLIQTPIHATAAKTKKTTPFGCDALVMLMGEEIEMDDAINEELANFVMKEGTSGGHGLSLEELTIWAQRDENLNSSDDQMSTKSQGNNHDHDVKLDSKTGDWLELEEWLDGDDDEDDLEEEGTALVIGRTHLFTGEKRSYVGMPASSTPDETVGRFSLSAINRKDRIGPSFEIGWDEHSNAKTSYNDSDW